MIDGAELRQMRDRAEAARPAVEAVLWRKDGMTASLPYPDPAALLEAAAGSAVDVPALLAECERLAPAAYVHGPEACCDRDCDEEEPPDGQWCSHVVERVATFDDVKRAEVLAEIVQSTRRRLSEFSADELVRDIDDALESMEAAESAGWAH